MMQRISSSERGGLDHIGLFMIVWYVDLVGAADGTEIEA